MRAGQKEMNLFKTLEQTTCNVLERAAVWAEEDGCPAVLGKVGPCRRRRVRSERVSGSTRRCGQVRRR